MRLLLLLLVPFSVLANDCLDGLSLIGTTEWTEVRVEAGGFALAAKVDTGAATSSINAVDIEPFERGGQKFVRFRVPDAGVIETPVVKKMKVKSSNGEKESRYYVELMLCVGTVAEPVLFSLADRGEMKFPMLLGKEFLSGKYAVDVSRENLLKKPRCK